MIYIDITEKSLPTYLLGLKVNKSTLVEKNVTIEEVANLLRVTGTYVIGYDEKYSLSEEPHYHIHFISHIKFESKQTMRKRNLKGYDKTTKIYQAKDIADSDPYAWFGYAVKENLVYASEDLDLEKLKIQAATQLEIKKSKMKYGKKIENKREAKKTYEQKLFESMDKVYTGGFMDTAKHLSRISLDELELFLTISRVEYYTWKYLLIRKHITHFQYLESFQYKYNNINI